ncbi:MAG: di-heme oxidoredictase family protein, partial [Comamonas sp.]
MKKSTGGLIAVCGLAAALAAQVLAQPQGAAPVAPAAATPADHLPGGNTTVFATGRNAFSFPAANLSDAERTRFVIGNSFFKRNWVQAPASTTARDGLGPHF